MKKDSKLTEKQSQVLEFCRKFISENKKAPTFSEIAQACGYQHAADVSCHLTALRKKKILTWRARETRSIRFVTEAELRRMAARANSKGPDGKFASLAEIAGVAKKRNPTKEKSSIVADLDKREAELRSELDALLVARSVLIKLGK